MKLIICVLFLLFVSALAETSSPVNKPNIITLHKSNFVVLRGVIDAGSTSKFLNNLLSLRADEVYIYMITPGGSVIHGHQIIDAIKMLQLSGIKVMCIGDVINSMGFAIMQSCPYRYVRQNSMVMQHQMSLSVKGPFEQIKSRMQFSEQINSAISTMEADRLGLSVEEYNNRVSNDWWMYGGKAVDANAADELVHVKCTHELLSGKNVEEVETFFFGTVDVTYSDCPLMWDPLSVKFRNDKITPNDETNKIIQNIYKERSIVHFLNSIMSIS